MQKSSHPPSLLFCTHSHLLMPQAILTREGTAAALVTGQLPAEAREAVSLFNIPRSQVDRSKRPQCHTKQRTQSQNSSQSPGTTPWPAAWRPGLQLPHKPHLPAACRAHAGTCAALPSRSQPSATTAPAPGSREEGCKPRPAPSPSQTQRSLHRSHVKGLVSVLALGTTHGVRALILEHR